MAAGPCDRSFSDDLGVSRNARMARYKLTLLNIERPLADVGISYGLSLPRSPGASDVADRAPDLPRLTGKVLSSKPRRNGPMSGTLTLCFWREVLGSRCLRDRLIGVLFYVFRPVPGLDLGQRSLVTQSFRCWVPLFRVCGHTPDEAGSRNA